MTRVERILCDRDDFVGSYGVRGTAFGTGRICLARGLESASATTFTRVPHWQRHNVTVLAMTALSIYA